MSVPTINNRYTLYVLFFNFKYLYTCQNSAKKIKKYSFILLHNLN